MNSLFASRFIIQLLSISFEVTVIYIEFALRSMFQFF